MNDSTTPDHDVVVVGAGIAGMYAVHRMRTDGLDVLGLESADGVGGVWRHNRYPGARVDIESWDYCYYFSHELYNDWDWAERYAAQPELLAYLEHVADRFDIRRHFRFGTRMDGARWDPAGARWEVRTSAGDTVTARFLLMATGNLTEARKPDFPGLDDFQGRWALTAHWPAEPIDFAGKRVAVFGTGASGTQAIPVIAEVAESVHVFQRTPNFCVPSQNRAMDGEYIDAIRPDVARARHELRYVHGGNHTSFQLLDFHATSPEDRLAAMERQWAIGGHGMAYVFRTQGVEIEVNRVVADFVRDKVRQVVRDPETAAKLMAHDHPIGARRLVIETGYYDAFNRDTVHLVDLREEPLVRITPQGIKTQEREYEIDVIVFALGFEAFTGALDATDVRNERGERPTDRWTRRPQTLLGLMTHGFPNLFLVAGPGSPATLANVWAENEYHVDWVTDCILHLRENGYAVIEPTEEGERQWTAVLDRVSAPLLRRTVRNYMTHFNEDGTSYFIPFAGGLAAYIGLADEVAAKGYEGFALTPEGAPASAAEERPAPAATEDVLRGRTAVEPIAAEL